MEGELIPEVATLVRVCGQLGISHQALSKVESVDVLAHSFPVEASLFSQLQVADVLSFVDSFDTAARIEVRTGDLSELRLGQGITGEAIDAFKRGAASGGPYDVVVQIDKAAIASSLAGNAPARPVQVFVFAEGLADALGRGISWFEENAWRNSPGPLVISVLDTDIRLIGDELAVLGGTHLADVVSIAAMPPNDDVFTRVNASREREIGWDNPWVRALTPWHFNLLGECTDERLHGILRAQLVKLSVLFTCDRARAYRAEAAAPILVAEYRGRDHSATIRIDEREPIACTDDELLAVLASVEWCYRHIGGPDSPDWLADRLPFLQTQVAQALEPQAIDDRLGGFTHVIPYLLNGIEWHWKAFIEGRVGEYLDRVEQVETIVGDTVAAVANQTTGLATGLVQTMLAAVAVLIGSFIAAAFSKPFSVPLFRIAVFTYAAYVVLFPGVLGLTSCIGALDRLDSEFKVRIARFNETLYPQKVLDIVGERITKARSSFNYWAVVTAIIYILVAVAGILAACFIPHLVTSGAAAK